MCQFKITSLAFIVIGNFFLKILYARYLIFHLKVLLLVKEIACALFLLLCNFNEVSKQSTRNAPQVNLHPNTVE